MDIQERRQVLDHGYLQYVEHWGSDERIIEAARMSTGKGFQGWGPQFALRNKSGAYYLKKEIGWGTVLSIDRATLFDTKDEAVSVGVQTWTDFCPEHILEKAGDEKLLKFLYEKKHTTPFEMGGLVVEVQAPIFVFREWHRHRTQSYNEMSARYTPLPDVNYIPTVERLMIGSDGKNKQAGTIKGASVLTEVAAEAFRRSLGEMYQFQEQLYQQALASGVLKELARVHLPVGRYSRMRASANLLNWLKFLTLRMAPDAQYEIRQYANVVGEMISQLFPRIWTLFAESLPK